jgi:hypothetical protein
MKLVTYWRAVSTTRRSNFSGVVKFVFGYTAHSVLPTRQDHFARHIQ